MKKLFSIITLLISSISLFAQTNAVEQEQDSLVTCVGYFCKGDTMKYTLYHQYFKVEKNDTTWNRDDSEDFQVVVTDSTKDGYNMSITYLNFEDNLEDLSDGEHRMSHFINPLTKGMVIKFTTNEYGTVTKINNWREVKDIMINAINKGIDLAFEDMTKKVTKSQGDSLLSMLNIPNIKAMSVLGYANEESVRRNIEELTMLFYNHGLQYNIGEKKVTDPDNYNMTTSSVAGYTAIEDKDNDFDGDYEIMTVNEAFVPVKDAASIGSALTKGVINDSEGKVQKSIDDVLKECKDDVIVRKMEDATYWNNGWPKSVVFGINTNLMNIQIVKLKTISWNERVFQIYKDETPAESTKM